ncbi:MAG: glycoside hydrolase family 3 C-terminal domain-containing protein [Clostridia bacterium]|nr:glycoside hydrolase family 3 C-terminal domain-containing protein [Clostridia bacterium]
MNIEQRVEEILSQMTLQEKIGQLNQVKAPLKADEEVFEQIRQGKIGSFIMATTAHAGNDDTVLTENLLINKMQRIAVEESRLGIPIIYGRDVIHGHRTVYPIPLAAAASFNPELVEKCYRNIAREAAADGVNWTFSPMLDLCRDPRWGRIIEGPGEDPYVGAVMAEACVKGFQGENISDKDSLVACAKHYIGYGASEGGRDYHRTEISDYNLYNYYLPAFRAAVNAGVGTVMSSFNDISGQPVTSGKKYLTDILRGKLGFDGFVVSDWDAVSQLKRQGVAETDADCAELAINAGLDMNMTDRVYINNLESLVESGRVSEETINTAVKRVLKIKLQKGLFQNPYCDAREIDRTVHLKDARTLAAESMVLLKNDGVLPLSKKSRVALIGPFVRERRALLGSWTLDGKAEETANFAEAMKSVIGANMLLSDDNIAVLDNSIARAVKADVVVLALGESEKVTGEAYSVSDISLPKNQVELIHRYKVLGKKVVGVFFCGRPMAMEGVAEYLDAVLYAWHSGSETANAACDILFGDVVPNGKTAVTFPKRTGHIPMYYNVTSSGRCVNCYYGENPQNCYVDSLPTPAFPFGFGLSYTKFEYGEIKADTDEILLDDLIDGKSFKITVNVKNTGDFDGKETVQLYIRDKIATVMRPLRELKGFEKRKINKNETECFTFELGYDKLGFYTENGEYTVEKGEFEIYVGENCLTKNKITVRLT